MFYDSAFLELIFSLCDDMKTYLVNILAHCALSDSGLRLILKILEI